jgi:hypothetical protein
MAALEVVWIAPEAPGYPKLAWLDEIGQLADLAGVNLTIVAGPKVDRTAVARALQRRHDVTVWSGHGDAGVLLLANGIVQAKWLATQVRCGMPRVLVLAACGSLMKDEHLRSIAQEISLRGINAVGFPVRAEDDSAVIYNVELVRALQAGADLGAAHEAAIESIADSKTAAGVFLLPGLTNGYRDVILRLESLESGQDQLQDGVGLILKHLGIQN